MYGLYPLGAIGFGKTGLNAPAEDGSGGVVNSVCLGTWPAGV